MGERPAQSVLKIAENPRQENKDNPQWKFALNRQANRIGIHWKVSIQGHWRVLQGQKRWNQTRSHQTHRRYHDRNDWLKKVSTSWSFRGVSDGSEEVENQRMHRKTARTNITNLQTTYHLLVCRAHSVEVLLRFSQHSPRRSCKKSRRFHLKTKHRIRT